MAAVGLIVSDTTATAEGSADDIVRDLLVGMGHTVTLYDDSDSAAAVAAANAFLVVAPITTAARSAIGTSYKAVTVPVVVCSSHRDMWTDMFSLSSNGGQGSNRTWNIYATAVGTDLAAGYSGAQTVWSGADSSMVNYFTGTAVSGSVLVGNRNGNTAEPTVFAVPAGTLLADGATSTQGWRGAISANRVMVETYRTSVWENLFRALVDEAEANSVAPPPANESPTAIYAITPSQSVSTGTVVTATLTGSDTDGTIASYSHSLSVPGGSATTLSSTTAQAPTFTPDVAGAYVVTGTVTDDDGATSTPVSKTINAGVTPPPSGEPAVTQTATVDLTGIQASSGGALTYSVAFVSGDNAAAMTETSAGVFQRALPSITTVYSWTVDEAGGSSLSGTATIVVASGELLEDEYALTSQDPVRWVKISDPAAPEYDENGDPVP